MEHKFGPEVEPQNSGTSSNASERRSSKHKLDQISQRVVKSSHLSPSDSPNSSKNLHSIHISSSIPHHSSRRSSNSNRPRRSSKNTTSSLNIPGHALSNARVSSPSYVADAPRSQLLETVVENSSSLATSKIVGDYDESGRSPSVFQWPVSVEKSTLPERIQTSTDSGRLENDTNLNVGWNVASSPLVVFRDNAISSPAVNLRKSLIESRKASIGGVSIDLSSHRRFKPISPENIIELLAESYNFETGTVESPEKSKLVIFDYRKPNIEHDSRKIKNSFELFVMPIWTQRRQRRSAQSLSMDALILGDEGKSLWKSIVRNNNNTADSGYKIIVTDKTLPSDLSAPYYMGSEAFALILSILEKEAPPNCRLYWIKGGLDGFIDYCDKNLMFNFREKEILNSNWLTNEADTDGALGTPVKSRSRMSITTSIVRPLSIMTCNSDDISSLASAAPSMPTDTRPFIPRGSIAPEVQPDSPQNGKDFHKILDWLILGSDPSFTSTSIPAKDAQDSEEPSFWVEVPSPSSMIPTTRNGSFSSHFTMSNPASRNSRVISGEYSSDSYDTNVVYPESHSDSGSDFSIGSYLKNNPDNDGRTLYLDLVATKNFFSENNISCVINMAKECTDLSPYFTAGAGVYGFKLDSYFMFGIWDNTEENIEAAILKSVETLEYFHEKYPEKIVYLHCKAGRSRSATIAIAYLMKHNNWSMEEAKEYVKSKRPEINPNLGFICALQKLNDKWYK